MFRVYGAIICRTMTIKCFCSLGGENRVLECALRENIELVIVVMQTR